MYQNWTNRTITQAWADIAFFHIVWLAVNGIQWWEIRRTRMQMSVFLLHSKQVGTFPHMSIIFIFWNHNRLLFPDAWVCVCVCVSIIFISGKFHCRYWNVKLTMHERHMMLRLNSKFCSSKPAKKSTLLSFGMSTAFALLPSSSRHSSNSSSKSPVFLLMFTSLPLMYPRMNRKNTPISVFNALI